MTHERRAEKTETDSITQAILQWIETEQSRQALETTLLSSTDCSDDLRGFLGVDLELFKDPTLV